jgi:uncharacterized protein DUF3142
VLGARTFAGALAVAILVGPVRPPDRTIIPWAWERRELLRALPVQEVAYLAGTFGRHLELRPRMQPLIVGDGVQLDPVFRIEMRATTLSDDAIASAAQQIARVARRGNAALVQIDFDATASQRPLYRALLVAIRHALPKHTRISITALASWCMDDRWMSDLPIDEAVPMLFRMGPDAAGIRKSVAGTRFTEIRCRGSVGLATDESFTEVSDVSRIYVFHPHAWTSEAWQSVEKEISQWRK